MKPEAVVVWFKRDLRVTDHAPLLAATRTGLPVIPLYVVEPAYWQQPFASRRHWCFIHDCLTTLNQSLSELGQPLIVRIGEVVDILEELGRSFRLVGLYAHEESGNGWTYARDKAVIAWCRHASVPLHETPCNGVVRRLGSRDDWTRIRNTRMAEPVALTPDRLTPCVKINPESLPGKDDPLFGPPVPGVVQAGGREAALETLDSFLRERARHYIYRLSAPGPSEKYCSRLSPHLVWGSLSVKEVVKAQQARRVELDQEDPAPWKRNLSAFGSRIAWRCHFIQKIEDQPDIEFRCMHPAFEGMREADHNEDFLQAWMAGRTGYPFIDACMRNLVHEGWITFRMRALLVSFASYHLWLDWRKTGYHLARTFTDYEPGIHYSQLQMQSGVTGINTLRIYSPVKQSTDHDPHGDFVRQWIPELRNLPEGWSHEPWKMPESLQHAYGVKLGADYPYPLVDHATAVREARSRIGAVRKGEGFRDTAQAVHHKLGSRKKKPLPRKRKSSQKQLQLDLF